MGSNIAIVFAGGLPPEGGCSSPQRLRVESRSILSSAETSTDSGDLSYNHHHCQQQRINNENRTLSEDSNLLDVCPRVPQDIIRLSEAAWQYYASQLWYLLISILIIFSSQSHHILIIFSSYSHHILIKFLSYCHNILYGWLGTFTSWCFLPQYNCWPRCRPVRGEVQREVTEDAQSGGWGRDRSMWSMNTYT